MNARNGQALAGAAEFIARCVEEMTVQRIPSPLIRMARIAERATWNAARLNGQALLLAGSDFAECVEVFLQELLRSFVGPIQGDT